MSQQTNKTQDSDPMSLDDNPSGCWPDGGLSGIPSGVAICSPALLPDAEEFEKKLDEMQRRLNIQEKHRKSNNQRIKKINEITYARQDLSNPTPVSMLWITTRRAIETGGKNLDDDAYNQKDRTDICCDYHETILSMPVLSDDTSTFNLTDVIHIKNGTRWNWGLTAGPCISIEIRNFKPWPFSFERPIESTVKRVKGDDYPRYSICYRKDFCQTGGYEVLQWSLGTLGATYLPQHDISTEEACNNITEITRWLRWICNVRKPHSASPVGCYNFLTPKEREAQEYIWEKKFMCI